MYLAKQLALIRNSWRQHKLGINFESHILRVLYEHNMADLNLAISSSVSRLTKLDDELDATTEPVTTNNIPDHQ